MTAVIPGYDEVVLTAPDGAALCHSRACARQGRLAAVIVTFGVLNDPGAGLYAPAAMWRESWHTPIPMCGACWEQTRQVAVKYRPGLVVTDATPGSPAPAAGQIAGGQA